MSEESPEDGHTALVTGGGSGVGRAIALALAEQGHHVAVTGRRGKPLDKTASLAVGRHPVSVHPADVSSEDDVARLFETLSRRWRRLDLLVNNAGSFGRPAPIEDVVMTDWDAVLDVNLRGAFLCTRAAIRWMRSHEPEGGRIVNIGSVSAHRPRPDAVAYTVSKHAMTGLTRATALEGRAHAVACTQVDVGNASTGLLAQVQASPSAVRDAEPTFDPHHVGRLVAFLADLPPEVSVLETQLFATGMPLIGRG